MASTARKQRALTSDRIDQTKPAYVVIHIRFRGLANFCRLTGYPRSTAYDWMVKGYIQPRRGDQSVHAHILHVASENAIEMTAADLVDQPASDAA